MKVQLSAEALLELQGAVARSGKGRDAIAFEAKVSLRTVYYLLRGNSKVTLETLVNILSVVGVDVASFLSRHCGIGSSAPIVRESVLRQQTARPTRVLEQPGEYIVQTPHTGEVTVAAAVACLARQFELTPSEVMDAITSLVSRKAK